LHRILEITLNRKHERFLQDTVLATIFRGVAVVGRDSTEGGSKIQTFIFLCVRNNSSPVLAGETSYL
jgi:hypothetical protein